MKNRKTTSQSTEAIVSWYQITLNLEEQAILNAVRLGTLAAEHNTENKNHLESCLDLSSVNSTALAVRIPEFYKALSREPAYGDTRAINANGSLRVISTTFSITQSVVNNYDCRPV